MNNACFALTTLLSSVASMLLVGPAECQLASRDYAGMAAWQRLPCGEGSLDSIGSLDHLEMCIAEWHARGPVEPCLGPNGGSRHSGEWNSATVQEAATDPARGNAAAVAVQLSGPQDLTTGYDQAYDAAMEAPVEPQLPAFPLVLISERSDASTSLQGLYDRLSDSRLAGVVQRTCNGQLWRSSSSALRAARLAAAAKRATGGEIELERRLAVAASDQLERLGSALTDAAQYLRRWADGPRLAQRL